MIIPSEETAIAIPEIIHYRNVNSHKNIYKTNQRQCISHDAVHQHCHVFHHDRYSAGEGNVRWQ